MGGGSTGDRLKAETLLGIHYELLRGTFEEGILYGTFSQSKSNIDINQKSQSKNPSFLSD